MLRCEGMALRGRTVLKGTTHPRCVHTAAHRHMQRQYTPLHYFLINLMIRLIHALPANAAAVPRQRQLLRAKNATCTLHRHKLDTPHAEPRPSHHSADSGIAAPEPPERGRTVYAVVLQGALVADDQIGRIALEPLCQRVVTCTPNASL